MKYRIFNFEWTNLGSRKLKEDCRNPVFAYSVKYLPFQDRFGKRRDPFLAEGRGAEEGVEVLHRQDDEGAAAVQRIVLVRPEHPVWNDRVGAA